MLKLRFGTAKMCNLCTLVQMFLGLLLFLRTQGWMRIFGAKRALESRVFKLKILILGLARKLNDFGLEGPLSPTLSSADKIYFLILIRFR